MLMVPFEHGVVQTAVVVEQAEVVAVARKSR
jgi:hypothetical protein